MVQPKATIKGCDVSVVGSGIVGLSFAVALKQSLEEGVAVALWSPSFGRRSVPERVSAIAPASRLMLERLSIWVHLVEHAQPIVSMAISDARPGDAIHPINLRFEAADPAGPLAHMVQNCRIEDALENRARALEVNFVSEAIESLQTEADSLVLTGQQGSRARARLVAVADGARSSLRAAAGVATVAWDYGSQAIVCTLAHDRDHQGCARQLFFPEGPLAILPLLGRKSSIVWSVPDRRSQGILRLDRSEFIAELQSLVGPELGVLQLLDEPRRFPLAFLQARSLVSKRLALVGDAGHVIHPLAGQGLNMGFRDVAALAQVVADRLRLGSDPGAPDALREYETLRRFDTMSMGVATDALSRLFAFDSEALRAVRQWGMNFVDRSAGLKRACIREAAGLSGDPAKLLRGERV